ncbi:PucR family transcriptional regulator [Promicromonospora umidemergens]|uniref:PucR family transcriptional regulator n=1 Tax=Promicromonospora umidemergens TaxID=629679 RepID=UPI0020A24A50|nr:PucR family transcriptional regulator [Promicromonospora umidemergens]
MSRRPRASLGRVLDDLGATLLDVVRGGPDAEREVGGLVIHDPLDEAVYPPHALVLGVGLAAPDDLVALLRHLGEHGATGLVVREPVPAAAAVLDAADASGVALLGLSRGATWAQLAALLRTVLAEGDVGVDDAESLGGLPSGDLFAVANAVAALLDAPVTIEDRSSRVLAFSVRQDEADDSRVETVLGRRVPERYARMLTERGVFRDLYRSSDPVRVDPLPIGYAGLTMPRVAIAVRAGDEVLGSIWAAMEAPLDDRRIASLRDAAKLTALHLLRVRAGSDVRRRIRTDLLSTALEGGPGAREALERLGLGSQAVVVLGVTARPDDGERSVAGDVVEASERERLSDAFALHLQSAHPASAVALIGDVAYGLLPSGSDGEERAERIARAFVEKVGRRTAAVAAVGPVAPSAGGVARSREVVDRVLRVLRVGDPRGTGGPRVARFADVQAASLVLELRDVVAARGDTIAGPLARLVDYDAEHGAGLVATLRAWLDAFGDVTAAAGAEFVHPNTFRYRLRRVAQVGGIDLDDPEARFGVMLQLRVLAPGDGTG